MMILCTLWSNNFIIRIIIIIIGNKKKKLNSILDTESKITHFMGSNIYIIRKIKCWPVFKQDPPRHRATRLVLGNYLIAIKFLESFAVLCSWNRLGTACKILHGNILI